MNACVLAASLRTPLGLTSESATAAVRARVSAVRAHPFFREENGEPLRGAFDPFLEPHRMGWARLAAMVELPLQQLGEKLGLAPHPNRRVPLLLAVAEHRPGWSQRDERDLIDWLHALEVPGLGRLDVRVVARGHAGVHRGFELARELVARSDVDLCVVGGVDSCFELDTIAWLFQNRQIVTERTRSSFFPGEAAAFVAVSNSVFCTGRGARSLATLAGAGTSEETQLIKSDSNNLGLGLAEAVRRAADGLRPEDARIGATWTDLNGERYRTEEWGFVILRTQQLFVDASTFQAPASLWGDLGAASGAVAAALQLTMWQLGWCQARSALLVAGSESGLRGAVLLCQPGRG